MIKVVFVHGVNTRDGTEYSGRVEQRDARLKGYAFAGRSVSIANPYWGEFGAPASFSTLPPFQADVEHLGVAAPQVDDALLRAARVDLLATVGSLSAVSIESGGASDLADKERYWLSAAKYAIMRPRPAWLEEVTTDEGFLARLDMEVTALDSQETLGIRDFVAHAADSLYAGSVDLVNGPVVRGIREHLTPKVAMFLGDVLRYLTAGQSKDSIRQVVGDAIAEAADGEPVILIGHSMGGVILFDMLSDKPFMSALNDRIGHRLDVRLLLTVGTQVGLLHEIGVFGDGEGVPPAVQEWWNVTDRMDVLGYLVAPTIPGVTEYNVDTLGGVVGAHTAYFSNMTFYERLNVRLREGGILP